MQKNITNNAAVAKRVTHLAKLMIQLGLIDSIIIIYAGNAIP